MVIIILIGGSEPNCPMAWKYFSPNSRFRSYPETGNSLPHPTIPGWRSSTWMNLTHKKRISCRPVAPRYSSPVSRMFLFFVFFYCPFPRLTWWTWTIEKEENPWKRFGRCWYASGRQQGRNARVLATRGKPSVPSQHTHTHTHIHKVPLAKCGNFLVFSLVLAAWAFSIVRRRWGPEPCTWIHRVRNRGSSRLSSLTIRRLFFFCLELTLTQWALFWCFFYIFRSGEVGRRFFFS